MSCFGNTGRLAALLFLVGSTAAAHAATFADDLAFLRQHTPVLVLAAEEGRASVAVTPDWQGRVMTSTANGPAGISHGWLNRPVIARGTKPDQGNPYGGEDRFWLAPMGTEFSLFYPPDQPFDDDHWRVPDGLNRGAATVRRHGRDFVDLHFAIELENYQRTRFPVEVDRRIQLFDRAAVARSLDVVLADGLQVVGFESVNTATNRGAAWTPDSGLLSVWILGMFPGREQATIISPLRGKAEASDINRYLAPMGPDRFAVSGGVVYFRGDGRYRSKFGILPPSTGDLLGSYDPSQNLLTVVTFLPLERAAPYPNGFTGPQPNPWEGDVVSSYNNGPLTDTVAPQAEATFYELESCSPVRALARGEKMTHTHRTYHFEGTPAQLDPVMLKLFGVSSTAIVAALK